jgi:hypothetical protein
LSGFFVVFEFLACIREEVCGGLLILYDSVDEGIQGFFDFLDIAHNFGMILAGNFLFIADCRFEIVISGVFCVLIHGWFVPIGSERRYWFASPCVIL